MNYTGDDFETTNFESFSVSASETFKEGILGPIESDIKFGGDWDAGTNPFTDDPPGLYPRDDLANVLLYVNRIDGTFWDFAFMRVRGATNSADIKGKVLFNIQGKSQGPWLEPAGDSTGSGV